MHIVTVGPQIPDPATGGGGNWGSSLIRQFVQGGHRVTHVAVLGKHGPAAANPDHVEAFRRLGAAIAVVPYPAHRPAAKSLLGKLRSLVRPRVADVWPLEVAAAPEVARVVRALRPDCVVAFAFDATIYTDGLTDLPRISVLAEGPHINTMVNLAYDPQVPPGFDPRYWLYWMRTVIAANVQERIYVDLLRRRTVVAFQGAHYVRWAHGKRLDNVQFVTTPTPDPVGTAWQARRAAAPRNAKCRILMIGHLHSTSNRSGLPIFFEEILPALEREWHRDRFEIHIVGRNDAMPRRFDRFRAHPALTFRGPVVPADEEFLRADILLVQIPAKTGSRVRILNGWSFGCCVVAHTANQLGIPELEHEKNALLAPSGREIARQVMRAADDPELRRRLGEAGRRMYESNYAEAVGAAQYLGVIERAIALHASKTGTTSC